MCLITYTPDYQIAKAPIKVYKLLLKGKGDYYKSLCGYGNDIVVGDIVTARYDTNDIECINGVYLIKGEGVHAFVSLDAAKGGYVYDVITEWEIPIGAKYWIGDGQSKGQIAASEMKFIKVCKEKKNY